MLLPGFFIFCLSIIKKQPVNTAFILEPVDENTFFVLKRGDILVRPNSDRLPGSCAIPYGRIYGHVAIVTEGATGQTINEALEKAKVIEALFLIRRRENFNGKRQTRSGKRKQSSHLGIVSGVSDSVCA